MDNKSSENKKSVLDDYFSNLSPEKEEAGIKRLLDDLELDRNADKPMCDEEIDRIVAGSMEMINAERAERRKRLGLIGKGLEWLLSKTSSEK
ncbi:hypothetical protein KJ632_03375 [Patescibacteria group bacterium]|nr:hypothetical protein [Patescibacteria group bacterium]